jgi:hypothetical protein
VRLEGKGELERGNHDLLKPVNRAPAHHLEHKIILDRAHLKPWMAPVYDTLVSFGSRRSRIERRRYITAERAVQQPASNKMQQPVGGHLRAGED